jgi:hypothetical protein
VNLCHSTSPTHSSSARVKMCFYYSSVPSLLCLACNRCSENAEFIACVEQRKIKWQGSENVVWGCWYCKIKGNLHNLLMGMREKTNGEWQQPKDSCFRCFFPNSRSFPSSSLVETNVFLLVLCGFIVLGSGMGLYKNKAKTLYHFKSGTCWSNKGQMIMGQVLI